MGISPKTAAFLVNLYLKDTIARYESLLEEGVILSIAEGQVRSRLLPVQKREQTRSQEIRSPDY